MLYVLAGCIGFVAALLFIGKRTSEFEQLMNDSLMAGQQVIISIGERSFIFRMNNGTLVIRQATIQYDLDTDRLESEDGTDTVDSVRPDQLN